jgi:site-specific DNA-methyltransferase (cytosine-N4-specific)
MTTNQLAFFGTGRTAPPATVGVEVRAACGLSAPERQLLSQAHLDDIAPIEAWKVTGTNKQLSYSTHGVFRFFGKFPPPIARHLIGEFSERGDWILDPMMGSGTTAVEALDMARNVVVRDVSPLSTLLCRVKTTHVAETDSRRAFDRVAKLVGSPATTPLPTPIGLRNAAHWFLPETIASLGRIRAAIEPGSDTPVRELLLTAFTSTVRRVSKATTQQGRLFLDVEKAKPDAWPTFCDRFDKYASAVATLPRERKGTRLQIEQLDARSKGSTSRRFRLAITHPPYFNNYKYSSVNSLELAWLGVAHKEVRADEIREAFKIGKPEKVTEYVEDLAAAVAAISEQLEDGGVLALMMGDTIIREGYIDVTRQLLRAIEQAGAHLRLDRVVLRVPQYTEASWVASQRRTGDKVGVTLNDFILLFTKPTRVK